MGRRKERGGERGQKRRAERKREGKEEERRAVAEIAPFRVAIKT